MIAALWVAAVVADVRIEHGAPPVVVGRARGADVVIDVDALLTLSHRMWKRRPTDAPGYRRQLGRTKHNFASLLAGIVACAEAYREGGWASCNDDVALELYLMLAASWRDDADTPPALRMADLLGAPILARGAGSFFAQLRNPLLAQLGIGEVSCHPVINDDTRATCLVLPR